MKSKKFVAISIIGISLVICILAAVVYYQKGMQYWFPGFVKQKFHKEKRLSDNETPHVIVLFVDHYEPTKQMNVDPWMDLYPKIAKRYPDADGVYPQWTWAMPIEQENDHFVSQIAQLCRKGYGEIQLQLHHNHDTPDTLRKKLSSGIQRYSRYGAFVTQSGNIRFGFVHGNWSLDNANSLIGKNHCGVNNEIEILLNMGCFVDLTFPATGYPAQPSLVNSMYYAIDSAGPKSYDTGELIAVGKTDLDGLMMLVGPLNFDWSKIKERGYPGIENGQLQGSQPITKSRVDVWLKTAVHVYGKPDWIFVKLYTHGAHPADWNMLFGSRGLDLLFSILDSKMKAGDIILHYATAREAFNIVKAAQMGKTGDPGQYRDFVVKPYLNQSQSSE